MRLGWRARVLATTAAILACTPDAPPPAGPVLLLVQPPPGAEGVPRDAKIIATFDLPLAPATTTGAEALRVALVGPGGEALLPGAWGLEEGGRSLTFAPAKGVVPFGARVRLTLGTRIHGVSGGRFAQPITWEYVTEEPPALQLVRVSPPEQVAALDRAPELALTFTEPPECDDFGENGADTTRVSLHERRDPAPRWADPPGTERLVAGRWSCRRLPPNDPGRGTGVCQSADTSDPTDYCTVRFLAAAREASGPERARLLAGWGSELRVRLRGGRDDHPVRSARTILMAGPGGTTRLAGALAAPAELRLQVAHPPALVLVSGGPSQQAGEEGAPRTASVTLAFNEPVSCPSLAGVSLTELFDPLTAQRRGVAERAVAGRWSCAGRPDDPEQTGCGAGGCAVVLTAELPAGAATPFRHSSRVAIALPGQDGPVPPLESMRATSEGGRLPQGLALAFRVEDPPPLLLARSTPAPDATGVRRDGPVDLSFSEPPDCDALLAAVSVEATPATGGTPGPVDGLWTCVPPPPEDPAAPGAVFACGGQPDRCRVLFRPFRALGASSTVAVALRGGPHAAGALVTRSARATARGGQLPSAVRFTFRTADPPPLFVSFVSPAPGAQRVARDAPLELLFSEPVDCASLGQRVGIRARGAGDTADAMVAGHWSCPAPPPDDPSLPDADRCGPDGFRCRTAFHPHDGWPWSAEVHVVLPGGPAPAPALLSARATTRGGRLAATVEARFTVVDPLPPVLSGTDPAPGSDGRLAQEALRLHFSPAGAGVRCASIIPCTGDNDATCTLRITERLDPVVGGTAPGDEAARVALPVVSPLPLECVDGGLEVVWRPDPARPFSPSSEIVVWLGGGDGPAVEGLVTTAAGGRLAAPVELSWRVADPPPLRLRAAFPADGAAAVPRETTVRLGFDAPVDCASGLDAITVTEQAPATLAQPQAPPAAPMAVRRRCADARLELEPSRPFAISSSITVRIEDPGGAGPLRRVDATTRGGLLAGNVSLTFRVTDPPPLQIVGFSPGATAPHDTDVRLTFDRPIACATAIQRLSLYETSTDGLAQRLLPGTVTCSGDGELGPAVDGPLVIFTPGRVLTLGATHRFHVEPGIVPADATVVSGVLQGLLPQPWDLRFEVPPGELRVMSALPSSQFGATIGTALEVRFGQPVDATTLRPCGAGGGPAACNVWINPGPASDRTAALPLTVSRVDSTGLRVLFDPEDGDRAPDLQPGRTYAVTVLGGANGPRGALNGTLLATSFSWTFDTLAEDFVLSTTPAHHERDADPGPPVCVEFAGELDAASLLSGGTPQLTLTTTDELGRTVDVPLATDGAGPYVVTASRGLTANVACLRLAPSLSAFHAGPRLLRPSKQYFGRVSTAVTVGGRPPLTPYRWSFTTRALPGVREVRVTNGVSTRTLSEGLADVPVNSQLLVSFDEAMDPGSLVAPNVQLRRAGTTTALDAALTLDSLSVPHSVALKPASRLAFSTATAAATYVLELRGGVGGLRTATGAWLDDDTTLAFTTSRATTVAFNGADGVLLAGGAGLLTADQPLGAAAFSPGAFRITRRDVPVPGLLLSNGGQPQAAVFLPFPALPAGAEPLYRLETTAALVDARGNPIDPARSPLLTILAPPASARRPATATCVLAGACAISPPPTAVPSPLPDGTQGFVFTLPAAGPTQRMLAVSYAPDLGGRPGTVSLVAIGGASCPEPGTIVPTRVVYEPSPQAALPDRVRIDVRGPLFLRRGCEYELTLRQASTPNLLQETPLTAGCAGLDGAPPTDVLAATPCETGRESPGLRYLGENVPPRLVSVEVQDRLLEWIPADGATGVSGGTRVRLTFSEPVMAPSETQLVLAGVTARRWVEGPVAYLQPDTALPAGSTRTLTIAGVTDVAENPFAGRSLSFQIESDLPAVESATWDGTGTREAPFGTLHLRFDEPLAAASVAAGVPDHPAPLVTDTLGLAQLDASDPGAVLFRPAAALPAGVRVRVQINPPASERRLLDLAGTPVTTATVEFTP